MSSQAFKDWAKSYLEDFKKSAKTDTQKDRGDVKVTGRGKLEAQNWSILVVDAEKTAEAISEALNTTFASLDSTAIEKTLKTIMLDLKGTLQSRDVSMPGNQASPRWNKAWEALDPSFKEKIVKQKKAVISTERTYSMVVGKYSTIVDWKKASGLEGNSYILQAIARGIKKVLNKEMTTQEVERMGGSKKRGEALGGGQFGLQLEHGQSGGIGAGTARVFTLEGILNQQKSTGTYEQHQFETYTHTDKRGKKSQRERSIGTETRSMYSKGRSMKERFRDYQGKKRLKDAIAQYKVDMNLQLERDAYMNADGLQFHAHYAPILTITSSASNQEKAQSEENAFLKKFEDEIKALMTLEGSSTIDEMARDGVLHNLNGNGKGRTTRGAGKPRRNQKAKTKGKAKGSFDRKEEISQFKDTGHTLTASQLAVAVERHKNKGRAAPRSGDAGPSPVSSRLPLHLIGIINKELPDTVRANMGAPALTNVTGRFASSVRATDMIPTPQGFPSIGYTYQRDPYEVHEQDSNYDPRRLIDRSMREIASQHAIGRFYTRRV